MPSIHPEISDRLLSYLDGQLDEGLRRQVHEHLESCEACSEELAGMKVITRALRQAGRDTMTASTPTDRYGCPGPEELALYEAEPSDQQAEDVGWISRHLQACPRCQQEIDLIRLMRSELSMQSVSVAPQDLSARVEERMMARFRQGQGADRVVPFIGRFPAFSPRFLARAALGMGLAAAVVVSGILYLTRGPTMIAQRSSEQDLQGLQAEAPLSPPEERQPPAQGIRKPKVDRAPTSREPIAPQPPAPVPSVIARIEPSALPGPPALPLEKPAERGQTPPPHPPAAPSPPLPSVVARVEPPAHLSPPLAGRLEPPVPSAPERPRGTPTTPSIQPGLPPLVPAKQRDDLKMLILPTPTRPGLRSAVAAGLQGSLEIVQPPDRDFPAEPSVDDLTANRRLGRLYGVRYVLEIDVKQERLGYLVFLRAADTETGGVVATIEGQVADEGSLASAVSRLATELQQELKSRP